MEEYIEKVTLIKLSCFEEKTFYIFQNAAGEFRTLETDKFENDALQPGDVLQARMRKKGCAGREITELILS
ncbi:hypothetical protein [Parabacteroides sp. FAFU027]|uniref:hypothetical protein n=1 Tax=Parabacteroides sp. FAFU027 TaxID=2922715 RepID=UPI001FAEA664|nr:hypothetical protein [Parabacteroides sp. FAFU027]